jgi:two-component system, LytTR family, response regulator
MKAVIVEDETLAQNALMDLLYQHCPNVNIAGIANTGEEGISLIQAIQPDLIFLDIELPDITGFEVLQRLHQSTAEVVFVTGFNDYAIQAFEFSAIGYLVKPVEVKRLIHYVGIAEQKQQLQKKAAQYRVLMELLANHDKLDHRIVFTTQSEIVFSWLRNLIRIDADANFSMVKLLDNKDPLRVAKNIGEYEKLFSNYPQLMRVHRSHLLNLFHIKRYIREEDSVQMIDGFKIPVANNRKEELIERLGNLGDLT